MPYVDDESLESLVWEAELGGSRFDAGTDEGALAILDSVCSRISLLRHDRSLSLWNVVAVWIVGGVAGALCADTRWPVTKWYDWPFVWLAWTGLVGIALIVVYGVTVFAHSFWWERFGPGKRDAEFYGEPLTRRPGAGRVGD
jgi:hypothetical protein